MAKRINAKWIDHFGTRRKIQGEYATRENAVRRAMELSRYHRAPFGTVTLDDGMVVVIRVSHRL